MRKILLIIAVGLSLMTSCSDDLLDVKSTSKMDARDVFSNTSSIEAMRLGIYGQMAYKNAGALYTLFQPIIGGLSGDDMVYGNAWYQILGAEANYTVAPSSSGSLKLWSESYYVIEATNSLLENLAVGNAKLEPKKVLQFRAEAKAIRAMVHVDLARYFSKAYALDNGASAAIPYMSKLNYTGLPFRNTLKYVYAMAIKDLNESIVDLPAVTEANAKYMNRNAANAVLARIYLDMHDYTKALSAATAAAVPLMDKMEYFKGGLTKVNTESILAFANDVDKMSKWRTFISFSDNYEGMGDDYVVNKPFAQSFSDNDLRKYFFLGETIFTSPAISHFTIWDIPTIKANLATYMEASYSGKGYPLYGKFPRRDAVSGSAKGGLARGEYNYIRGSEMTLIIAECEARIGSEPAARTALESIANRMSEDGTKLVDASLLTGQNLLDAILLEKRRELLGEGHDRVEILRLGKGLVRTGTSHAAMVNLPANSSSFVWPIPEDETNVNGNLKKPAQDPVI